VLACGRCAAARRAGRKFIGCFTNAAPTFCDHASSQALHACLTLIASTPSQTAYFADTRTLGARGKLQGDILRGAIGEAIFACTRVTSASRADYRATYRAVDKKSAVSDTARMMRASTVLYFWYGFPTLAAEGRMRVI
jgi:hypothetical protein